MRKEQRFYIYARESKNDEKSTSNATRRMGGRGREEEGSVSRSSKYYFIMYSSQFKAFRENKSPRKELQRKTLTPLLRARTTTTRSFPNGEW